MNFTKNRTHGKYILYAVIALFMTLFWFVISNDLPNVLRIKSLLLLLVYVFYIVAWIRSTHKIKSLFFFFLCYTAMTNAGQLFLYALNIDVIGSFSVFDLASKSILCKSMDFQFLCTVWMCTLALMAHENHACSEEGRLHKIEGDAAKQTGDGVNFSDIVFIVSGITCFAFNMLRLESRKNAIYLDAFNSGEAAAAPFLLVLIFYISMYYACYMHRAKGDPFKKVIVVVNVMLAISNVMYGSRNVLIPILFGMAFLWGVDLKKLSLSKKIGLAAGAILLLYLLGSFVNLRRMSLSALSFDVVIDALFGKGIKDQIVMLISEMGGSLRVLTHTIMSVDGGVQSEQTFLYTVMKGVVPQVELLDMVGIEEPVRWRLSEWITRTYGQNAGWGYSMYAEAYYNFKWFGFLFMGAFGYFYVWLESKIEQWYVKGYAIMASAWLYTAVYFIFLARADSILVTTRLRYAIYLTIICTLLRGRMKPPRLRITLK